MSGFLLQNGKCIKEASNCSNLTNCQVCNGSKCLLCNNYYSLYEGSCVLSCPPGFYEKYELGKGSYCVSKSVP